MTLPDPAAPFKRPRRRWLFLPYAVVVVAVFVWSILWLEIRNQVALAMDRAAADAKAHGVDLGWKTRTIGGYPFRIEVTLDGFAASEPSGWALDAPHLKAIANAYDLEHWVAAADDGVVLGRPGASPTRITGTALRASWVGKGEAAPRIVAEGLNLAFAPADPANAAKPFPLTRLGHGEVFTRTEPDGRMDAGFLLENAQPRASSVAAPSLLPDLTANRPFAVLWQGIVSQPKAFAGASAHDAALAWSRAGGSLTTVRAGMASGGRTLGMRPGALSLDPDGHVAGQVGLVFHGADGAPVRAMGQDHLIDPLAAFAAALILDARAALSPEATINLTFQSGVTSLGPVPIGPAPKPF